ncbi:hypothetical protein AXFE_16310 [Acidithrix ferrooxidans]|uniref:Uncharacterized protein n=1 Tax=Acidithrix ferrooxidans TaxID=1280514 RepID=A0A0D8HK86_9ACTN|nr:hypothetical protein AXFE_16310 [Acidithrix ferrooxidans]
MSPYTAQLTLPRLGEPKQFASFCDLQARSFRAEKLTPTLSPAIATIILTVGLSTPRC